MRRVPYSAPLDAIEPAGRLVVLNEQPVRVGSPAPVRRLPSGVGVGVLLALALFFGGVAWGAARTTGPRLQNVSIPGGSPITLGAATIGSGTALYPGGAADLSVPVANPNSFPILIRARIDGRDCREQALSLVRPLMIPASVDLTTIVFPAAVQMGVLASNDCQGQVLSVTLSELRVRR